MVGCQLPKLITRVRFPSLASLTPGILGREERAVILAMIPFISVSLSSTFWPAFTHRNPSIFITLTISLLAMITGCATTPMHRDLTKYPEQGRSGIFHKVKAGQTLWRIARTYDVSMQDIILANNMPPAAKIEENQLLFIPGAHKVSEIHFKNYDRKDEFAWPIEGKIAGYFHQSVGRVLNRGIIIHSQRAESVRASRSGRVVFADYLSGYGNTVIIDHEDGFYSIYANTAEILVVLNDYVARNKEIARLEKDKNLASLHFEIRKNAIEENPLHYLP